jgi:hypothetical protein
MSRSLKILIKTWRRAYWIYKSDEDGEIYFLETSSRVGGAHLADIAAASDINLWKEWAAIEDALVKEKNIRYQK